MNQFLKLGVVILSTIFLHDSTQKNTQYNEQVFQNLIEHISQQSNMSYDDNIILLKTISLNKIKVDLHEHLTPLDTVSTNDINEDFSSSHSTSYQQTNKKGAKSIAPKAVKLNLKKMV